MYLCVADSSSTGADGLYSQQRQQPVRNRTERKDGAIFLTHVFVTALTFAVKKAKKGICHLR